MTRMPDSTLRSRFTLSRQILESHYNAPATALWRVFEAEVVLNRLRGQGRGLDLGCGDGELASLILSHTGMRWTGLEIDEHDVELARLRGVYAEVKHACDPVADSFLPFPRRHSTISCSGAASYTPSDSSGWRNDTGPPWIAGCSTGTCLPPTSGATR
ncbi:MAG: class I SAM-dependent methyltransferase [Deltaproteobacteria bacterium]|nr:MAG: class I SAM-dependent methyltransferase [Deltaproteobacteria bacterium]